MELSDLSFRLYDDDALTETNNGLFQLKHNSDQSDNPRDYVVYFGSTNAERVLRATSNPGVDNITLTPSTNLTTWTADTVVEEGDSITSSDENGYRYVADTVTGAGETGSTEPVWPTSGIGSTVSDGDVTWKLVAAAHTPDEITLATSAADLETNTAGAALSLGTSLNGGVANAFEIHMRIENAVTTVSNNSGEPELAVAINEVTESAAVA